MGANAEMALPGHFRLLCLLAMLVTTTGNEIFASIYAGGSCASPSPNLASFKHTLDQCVLVSLSAEANFYVKTSLSGSTYSTTFSETATCDVSNAVNPNPVAAAIDTCSAAFNIGADAYKEMFSNAYASDALKTFDCTSSVCVETSSEPSSELSSQPSSQPSSMPSAQPSSMPSAQPSSVPSAQPSSMPSAQPSSMPSVQPSAQPSSMPSAQPSSLPSS